MSTSLVPVIDIAPFRLGGTTERKAVVESLRAACEDIGFFSVVGHGVDESLVTRTQNLAKDFFALPPDQKRLVERPPEKISRGYSHVGDLALSYSRGEVAPPDIQESFAMGPLARPDDPHLTPDVARRFFASNRWPEHPVEFAPTLKIYYEEMSRLAGTIMRIFALALDLDEGFFEDKIDRATSTMRLIRYPEQHAEPLEGQLRAGAHTDYGTVTILRGEDVPGGLQVLSKQGSWDDVHPVQGSFICNIGDLMARWTNDRWVSTMHRVVNPPREHAMTPRLSIVFFHNPNHDADIRCIESCIRKGERPRYEPVTFGDYYLSKHMKAQHMGAENPAT